MSKTKKTNKKNPDHHKTWLVLAISVAIIIVLVLFLYSPVRKAVIGKAITLPGQCQVVGVNECEGAGIIYLNQKDNAHGYTEKGTATTQVLCCGAGISKGTASGNTCSEGISLLYLNQENNAHASAITSSTDKYKVPVCISGVTCGTSSTDGTFVIGLNRQYNAHLYGSGYTGDSAVSIYCKPTGEAEEEICDNEEDDDADGFTDCADYNCFNKIGPEGLQCCDSYDGICPSDFYCDDGSVAYNKVCIQCDVDNDCITQGLGSTCQNYVCYGKRIEAGIRPPSEEICNNEEDEDTDGNIDCFDIDCAGETDFGDTATCPKADWENKLLLKQQGTDLTDFSTYTTGRDACREWQGLPCSKIEYYNANMKFWYPSTKINCDTPLSRYTISPYRAVCEEISECQESCESLGYGCGYQTICGESIACGPCASGFKCNTTTWKCVSLITADFDNTGCVDMDDFLAFAASFDKAPGEAGYNSLADLDNDNDVDMDDFLTFAGNFGTGCE